MKRSERQPEKAQELINALMLFADEALKSRGGFKPVGATLNRSGETALLNTYADTEGVTTHQVADWLTDDVRARAAGGEVEAAALAAMVLYGKSGSGELSTAVSVHVEQSDGYCADIFMPYRIRGGMFRRPGDKVRVRFSQPVAQESGLRFWKGREEGMPNADKAEE